MAKKQSEARNKPPLRNGSRTTENSERAKPNIEPSQQRNPKNP
jgi:hypothetical protein